MVVVWLAGCTGPDTTDDGSTAPGTGPEVVGTASVTIPGDPVYLAARLDVTTDVATTAVLTIDGPEGIRDVAFPRADTAHALPVLGLRPDTTYTVSAVLTDADGATVAVGPFDVDSGPTPTPFPEIVDTLVDPARMEPGFTLVPTTLDGGGWIVALDAELVPVYAQAISGDINGVTLTTDGNWAMVEGFTLRIADVWGATVRRWTQTPTEPVDVAVPFDDFHHELVTQPDGTVWTLTYEHVQIDDYPQSYQNPEVLGPAEIRNDMVVHLAADGTILGQWPMLDLMDHHHIGFDGLAPSPSGALDWVHTNALQYDAETDEITLSMRHQDAVIRFSAATGALKWIFGSPYGWAPEFQPYLLTPTEDFVWPTHQHGIEIDPDGTLRMFDNGNDDRSTPYHASGQGREYSRLFEVKIDEAAKTVTPLGEFGDTATGPLFAISLGNADKLPITGNRLATWGTTPRIIEYQPDGTRALEFGLNPGAWRVDRASHLASLYPADVVVTSR
ncbi:MAG: aryl-sulfate sulfotransferase [Myxococcota bacterium]